MTQPQTGGPARTVAGAATVPGRPEAVHLAPSGLRPPASWHHDRLVVHLDDPLVVAPDGLSSLDIARVHGIGAVHADGPAPATEAAVRTLLQLAATGVLVTARPGAVPGGPGAGLGRLITAPLPDDEALAWEARSVHQRTRAAWELHRRDGGTAPPVTLMLTTRRPDDLLPAVRRLAAQRYPDLRLLLVLHGDGFSDDLVAQAGEVFVGGSVAGRSVAVVPVAPGAMLGEALREGSRAVATDLVTKVDDDDLYGPHHVADLVLARTVTGAEVVGKGPSFVQLEDLGTTVWDAAFPPERVGPRLAGGTLLLSRAWLERIGGWEPLPEGVDTALLEATAESGGSAYRTHPFGFVLARRGSGHTWRTPTGRFLRRARAQWGVPPRSLLDPAE